MKRSNHNPARRHILRGIGGIAVGLPALDIFEGRVAKAQAATKPTYTALLLQQNGAVQGQGDADMFWPPTMGPITTEGLAAATDRTTTVLKDYAPKLNFVRGLNFKYSNNHDGGPFAASTGAPKGTGSGTSTMPAGESYDWFIARNTTPVDATKAAPAKEPLALYTGRKGTFRDDCLSFSTGGKLRTADNNPWNVYQRVVMGGTLPPTDPAIAMRLINRRKSINDAIRTDLRQLLARTDLSKLDRERIDLHLTSVRDLEIGMGTTIGPAPIDAAGIQAVNSAATTDANFIKVVQFQLDIAAWAFAADKVRTANLQIGGCNDHTRYTIDGVLQPPYHFISHRVQSDGGSGTAIADAVGLHHKIDIIHANYFKYFLDKLSSYTLPTGGTLLDAGVYLWTNSVSNGPPHSGTNIPHVLAGGANGFLKTGNHIKITGETVKVLNTMISACGVRKADGNLVDNFNAPSGAPGLVTEIIA